MKIINVDKDKCVGCGACAGCEPNVFEIGDDGFAQVINDNFDNLSNDSKDAVENACDGCPTEAISINEN